MIIALKVHIYYVNAEINDTKIINECLSFIDYTCN